MKKLLLLALIFLGSSVYAIYTLTLPDTPTFPRTPTGSGTIGSVIATILGTLDLGNYL